MSEVRFVKELEAHHPGQRQCLVEKDGSFYVVSSIVAAPDHGGPETLVFAAFEDGQISSFTDLAGGRGVSREEAIKELDEQGPDPDSQGRGVFGDTKPMSERDPEEQIAAIMSNMEVVFNAIEGGDND